MGPIQGRRWYVDPIAHKFVKDGARRSLRVRTGFFRLWLVMFLSIGSFVLLGLLIGSPSVALVVAPFTAWGLTILILRLYRSLFWEVTFDKDRGVVEMQRGRATEIVPLAQVGAFQICRRIDKKTTGFFRYHYDYYQLILVYERDGEIQRRLISATSFRQDIVELMDKLRKDVQIDVAVYPAPEKPPA